MWKRTATFVASLALLRDTLATDVLTTDGFTNCNNGSSTVQVNDVNISFDRSNSSVTFDVAGSSEVQQNVTATMTVTAYGQQVYTNTFNPCDASTKVDQLCPVPQGNFAAQGSQTIPSEYVSKIPAIAFSIPDVEIQAQMTLQGADGTQVACITSNVSNGKSVEIPAVSYVAAAIAAGALAASVLSAAMSGGHPGSSTSSPGFTEVMWWFQGMAVNGMHSVEYPAIYRSFSKNFAFSTGLIPWGQMQTTIDNFRRSTGGNLTDDSYAYLRNATLQFPDGSTEQPTTTIAKRALLFLRDVSTSVNGTGNTTASGVPSSNNHLVSGIEGYVEQLTIPQANTFMTVLLIFAIVVAAIVVGILLFKVILETWSLCGRLPKSLATFRKEYWRVMAQTIIQLILLLYGTWTLYCIFQFTHGDSWAAKVLAGVTLGIFSAILLFYVWMIFSIGTKAKRLGPDANKLFDDKPTWKKYRIFYDSYKRQYWWLFLPAIVYMFAKGCVLAAADGHGLTQTAGQLIIEGLMLILLLWSRPFNRRSGNWINIIIQIVRVLSVAVILTFVEELGLSKTTTTITGVVLVVVQASLTGILAILIAINAIISCVRENPHRRRRKAALLKNQEEGLEGDDFYNSGAKHAKGLSDASSDYEAMRAHALENLGHKRSPLSRDESHEHLISSAASLGKGHYEPLGRSRTDSMKGSPAPMDRQPALPAFAFEDYRHQRIPHAM